MTQTTAAPGPRQAALIFIFITAVLDIMAMGIIIPVLPNLILKMEGGNMESAAIIAGYFGVAWALMQFVFQPILGALSDQFGRRPVLLFSMAGLGLDYIVMALAPNLAVLFIGRLISGIAAATFATASAYIADITPPEKRSAAYGMMGAAFGFGFVLGPALGGYLAGIDPRLPFWVAAGLCIVNAFYGYFVLPESLPKERRKKMELSALNPLSGLRFLSTHPVLAPYAAINFLYMIAHNVFPAIWVLNFGHRFGWDEQMAGYSLAVVGMMSIIVMGGLVGPGVKLLGERRAMLMGLSVGCVGMIGYGIAPSPFWIWVTIPLAALWSFFGPALQSVLTRQVSPSEQGQLQGAMAGLMGLTSIFTPYMYTQTFAYAIGSGKVWAPAGLPFLVAGGFLVAALLLTIVVTRNLKPAIASGSG